MSKLTTDEGVRFMLVGIDAEIERLKQFRENLINGSKAASVKPIAATPPARDKKPYISPQGRQTIANHMRKMWQEKPDEMSQRLREGKRRARTKNHKEPDGPRTSEYLINVLKELGPLSPQQAVEHMKLSGWTTNSAVPYSVVYQTARMDTRFKIDTKGIGNKRTSTISLAEQVNEAAING